MSVGAVNKQTGDRIPTAGMPAIDDALDLTSVNPVQNAIITAALANKQDKTDNSLDTEAKTIVGAINEHEGDIDSLKSGLTNVESDVKLNTQDLTTPSRTKNLLPMTLIGIKSANTTGTWNGNAYTANGVTFTVQTDVDGNITKITSNGTAPATNTSLILASNADLAKLANNSVILNGSIGGASDTYLIVADHWNGDNSSASRDGDSVVFTPTSAFNKVEIVILNGYAPSNVEFYPMLRPASITDPTFAPYIPSVDARLDAVEKGNVSHEMLKSSTSVWSGDTLTFTVAPENNRMWRLVAGVSYALGTKFVEAYIVIRAGDSGAFVYNAHGTVTATYDYTTGVLTVTLPESSHWVYRMELAAAYYD